jgi:primosomal protein N' (replication factor Y)
MKFRGAGTEQIERALHAIFPEIRTIRIDADTTRHKGSLQRLLRDFATGKADVLLGTQMIAKGLHFPEVTLVGVLNSDASLNIPDFRASESVFQLITQVAGRAGRGMIPGEVIVQTSLVENGTIQLAAAQDYQKFYEEEVAVRQMFDYPPFTHLVKLAFSGPDEKQTHKIAETIRQEVGKLLPAQFMLNPVVPAGHAKVKDNFRFQFFIKGPNVYPVNRAILEVRDKIKIPDKIRLLVDVNPISTFF